MIQLVLYKQIQQEASKYRVFLESETLTLFVWFLSDNTLDSFQWVMDNRFMMNFHIGSGVSDYRSVMNFQVDEGVSSCKINYKSIGSEPQMPLDHAEQLRVQAIIDTAVSVDLPSLLEKIRSAVMGNKVLHWQVSANEERLLMSLKNNS